MQSSIRSKGCYTLWKDVINDENVNDVLKYSKSHISVVSDEKMRNMILWQLLQSGHMEW